MRVAALTVFTLLTSISSPGLSQAKELNDPGISEGESGKAAAERSGFITLDTRSLYYSMVGDDNGQALPSEYDTDFYYSGFVDLNEAELEALGYVESEVEHDSFQDTFEIAASGMSSSSAQDDYGYGIGFSESSQVYSVQFTAPMGAPIYLDGSISVSEFDGGSAFVSFKLKSAGASDIVSVSRSTSGTTPFGYSAFLPPGIYTLWVQVDSDVALGGGGDAYPVGEGAYDFLAEFYGLASIGLQL